MMWWERGARGAIEPRFGGLPEVTVNIRFGKETAPAPGHGRHLPSRYRGRSARVQAAPSRALTMEGLSHRPPGYLIQKLKTAAGSVLQIRGSLQRGPRGQQQTYLINPVPVLTGQDTAPDPRARKCSCPRPQSCP